MMEMSREERMEQRLKAMEDMGMKIDRDVSMRFFYHRRHKSPIKGLNLSPHHKDQTLSGLLNLAYGSQSDSSSSSSSSSRETGGSDVTINSDDSDDSTPREFSQFLTDDGCLRIDQILPLLPQVDRMPNKDLVGYNQTLKCAHMGLAHHNKYNKDDQYELVAPVMSSAMHAGLHVYHIHGNFLARPMNSSSDTAPLLFFVEMVANGDPEEDPVLRCCILKPNLGRSSPGPFDDFERFVVAHPEDVRCDCTYGFVAF